MEYVVCWRRRPKRIFTTPGSPAKIFRIVSRPTPHTFASSPMRQCFSNAAVLGARGNSALLGGMGEFPTMGEINPD
jgi:hypothetical protein